jgi:hypothetical protein
VVDGLSENDRRDHPYHRAYRRDRKNLRLGHRHGSNRRSANYRGRRPAGCRGRRQIDRCVAEMKMIGRQA